MKKSKLILSIAAVASSATLLTPILALSTSCFGEVSNDFTLMKTSTGYCITGLKAIDRSTITKIVVPEYIDGTKVVEISKGAFKGCINLESITLPFIGHTATAKGKGGLFGYVFGDEMYEGSGGYTWQEYSDNDQYEATDVEYAQYTIPSTLKSVTITNATSIPSGAFSNCRYLRNITVNSTANADLTIGNYAFYCCRLLRAFTIPSNTKSIGRKSFQGCYNLKKIEVPSGVVEIKHNAFANCISAATATIPSTVESMGKMVFENFVSGVVMLEDEDEEVEKKEYWDPEWIPSNVSIVYGYSNGGLFYTNDAIIALCGKTQETQYGSIVQWTGSWSLTALEIPSTFEANGRVYEIKNIGPNVFKDYADVVKVIIPDTITSISANAFEGCTKLEYIRFGNNLEKIGSEAFVGCENLHGRVEQNGNLAEGIDFKHVKTIGASAFKGIETIINVNFGDCLETIYDSAFEECHGLAPLRYKNAEGTIVDNPLIFPNTIKSIGNSAFKSACKFIPSSSEVIYQNNADVKFADGNENTIEFGESCFEEFGVRTTSSAYSKYIYIHMDFNNIKVNEFQSRAFMNANMYGMYNFPKDVETFGSYSFYDTNTNYSDRDTSKSTSKEFKIYTDKTMHIEDYAFYSFNDASIEFAKTDLGNEDILLDIGKHAFRYCSYAGNDKTGNKGTTEFIIPDSVESIGEWAFQGCSALRTVTLPSNPKFTRLEGAVFSSCTNLGIDQQSWNDRLTIPATVTYIGGSAFSYCKKLQFVEVKGNITTVGGGAFAYCESIRQQNENDKCLVFDDGLLNVTSFGTGVYAGCINMVYAPFPPNGNRVITSIPSTSFDGCYNLTNFEVRDAITSIGEAAFRKCYGMTKVTGMQAVKSIGKFAFYECSLLESVAIPSGCHTICDNAFAYCTKLGTSSTPDFVLPTDINQAWSTASPYGMGVNPFLGWTDQQTIYFTTPNIDHYDANNNIITRWGWTLIAHTTGNDTYYTCNASGSGTVHFVLKTA